MTVSHDNDSSVVVIVEERRASEESVVVVDEEDVSTSERTQLLEPEPEREQEDRPSTSEIAPGEHDLEASASETSPTAPAPSRKTGLFGFFNRYLGGGGSSASCAADPSGASGAIERQATSSVASHHLGPLCLEPLSQADFASGEAIHLDCGCRGDLAVRHRECAVKWSQVKDDGRGGLPQCELCKKPVKNLPELPRRPSREREREREQAGANVPVMTIEELMQGGGDQFDQFEQFVSDLLQFEPSLDRRPVERDEIDDAVDAEEVGCMQHVDVQRVALDPLAAVEQSAQLGDAVGDLDTARRLGFEHGPVRLLLLRRRGAVRAWPR